MSAAPLQRATALAVLAATAVVTGCGGEPAAQRVEGSTLAVRLSDYRFAPASVEMEAGRVRVEVVNGGRLPHALRLVRDGTERLKITTVLPGERDSARARLTRGSYRMLCPIGNHEELGMYGVLTVR